MFIVFSFLPIPKDVVDLMPFVSGKLMLAVLIVLSTASWTIILSKHFKLKLMIEADKKFAAQLKKTNKCLELYERNLDFPHSPFYQIYLAGAKTATIVMVGDHRPEFLARTQLTTTNTLTADQLDSISKGFDKGYLNGLDLLRTRGFRALRWIALTAVCLGLISTIYFMVLVLNEFEGDITSMLIASVIMVFSSFIVALPAEWYRLKFRDLYQKRVDKMIQFHCGIHKTFVRQLQKDPPQSPTLRSSSEPALKLPQKEQQKPRFFSLSKDKSAE